MNRLFVAVFLLAPLIAQGAQVYLAGVPSAWRLQNYLSGVVVVWYSGSGCASGRLSLPATATAADANRLYATINAAKNMGTKVFVYYDSADANCTISSFGVPDQ